MKGFTTKAIHSPALKPDPHGALRFPQYDSVAFEFESAKDIAMAFEGKKPAHSYSRITNPTVEDFEQRIRRLANAQGVIAMSSGMAAASSAIMAIAEQGTNIVTTKYLFGNTVSLFEHTMVPWGLEMRYADMMDPADVAAKIDENTRAVFLETITNPQLIVADIAAICAAAKEKGVPVILDGTLTTPYLFDAKAAGVAIEILSSTKYISGGATSVGGLMIDYGNFNWKQNPKLEPMAKKLGPFALLKKVRMEVYRNLGGCLSPYAAMMQTLGLETLALRVDRSCSNAMALAKHLSAHADVEAVNYPGLEDSPYHDIALKQFGTKFGGLLTFDLKDKETCFAFIDRLKLVRRATNLNDNKTLIIHPASTIFVEYSPEERAAMGVGETMIRLAVGIEDIEDLLEDFDQALAG